MVYVIECLKCNKQYVGETENALHIPMNGHQSDIKCRCLEKPVASHFNSEGHPQEEFSILLLNRSTGRRRTFVKQEATGFSLSDCWPPREWSSIHRPLIWNEWPFQCSFSSNKTLVRNLTTVVYRRTAPTHKSAPPPSFLLSERCGIVGAPPSSIILWTNN